MIYFFRKSLSLKQNLCWQRTADSFYLTRVAGGGGGGCTQSDMSVCSLNLNLRLRTCLSEQAAKFSESGEQFKATQSLCGDGRMQQARAGGPKKNTMWLSGGFCALPNQFIPVHQLCCRPPRALTRYRRPRSATPTPQPFGFCSLYL